MLPNILGYHCNDKKRCKDFIEKNKLIWSSSEIDGQWLGNGMYFWDNLSNAKYWEKEKQRKNKNDEFDIVVANISLQRFLDLTDEDVVCGVERYWGKLNDELQLTREGEVVYIGEKLNYLFEYVEAFKEFNTLKIHALYPRKKEKIINYKISSNKTPRPTTQVRSIFSIKNKSAILNSYYANRS